jgi:hypothetical protein
MWTSGSVCAYVLTTFTAGLQNYRGPPLEGTNATIKYHKFSREDEFMSVGKTLIGDVRRSVVENRLRILTVRLRPYVQIRRGGLDQLLLPFFRSPPILVSDFTNQTQKTRPPPRPRSASRSTLPGGSVLATPQIIAPRVKEPASHRVFIVPLSLS